MFGGQKFRNTLETLLSFARFHDVPPSPTATIFNVVQNDVIGTCERNKLYYGGAVAPS